ncbi:HK97 family phage prohead protease [Sphingobium sp. MI1205]|uniref:HK97 family phage prohead protease n=1 Tax=Sphingobium sp. MI1205 TaxID=407020 RepID=UPI000780BEE9|nr:HK97 family phage prohead protease [Sphingobium sp. MI1205]
MEKMQFDLREFKFAEGGDTMSLEGYGAVFGNVDSYGDVIEPGAFAKTLAHHKTAGTLPQMLLEHGFSASPLPVGKWTEMSEDGHGLKVKGEILPTSEGKDTYIALKAKAITGLSIGYRPVEFEMRAKPEDPRRRLKSVDLVEVSIVGNPANGKARVASVKSADAIITIRDLEDTLREAGFSKSEALAVCGRFQAKTDRRDSGADAATVADFDRLLSKIRA